jgi:hypothetical protein
MKHLQFLLIGLGLFLTAGCATVNKSALMTSPAKIGGDVIFKTAMAENEDAYAAGSEAAQQLSDRLAGTVPHAIIMLDCFDSPELKEDAIQGVASVFGADVIFGGAVYGMYTQDGAMDTDAVSLLALAGEGLQVQAVLTETMGASRLSAETENDQLVAALNAGGVVLATQLQNPADSDLVILMGDAHSPKNQFLLDGFHSVAGEEVSVTGGSISKNDGLNSVCYRGKMYPDSAIAIVLKGDLSIGQSGRLAKSNDQVISTAKEGAQSALKELDGKKPVAILAYDCAGRMGKLDNLSDEVEVIQTVVNPSVPIFGTYCAGEFGAADTTIGDTEAATVGRGWHVMFTALGQ